MQDDKIVNEIMSQWMSEEEIAQAQEEDDDGLIDHYILDNDNNPVNCSNIFKWDAFMKRSRKRILRHEAVNEYVVVTFFVGIDSRLLDYDRYNNNEKPILWKTMLLSIDFKNTLDYEDRYTSHQEAIKRHNEIVEDLKNEKLDLYV